MGNTLSSIRDFLIFNFGWSVLLGVGATPGVLSVPLYQPLWRSETRHGEYGSRVFFGSWVAMMFSCGLGIGFVFFSVAEPLTHLYESPHVIDMGQAGQAGGVAKAVQITLLDWGMHGWALFAVAAWAIAYPAYKYGQPLTVATGLYGILGERCNTSFWGRLANGLGIIGTIGGNATMIGLGVASISYGLNTLFGLELGALGQALVMIVVIIAYVISAATGVERGIKLLSQANMIMAGIILFAILFFGHAPAQYLLNLTTQLVGDYFGQVFSLQFWSDASNFEQREWLGWWVVFYWLWYISYIPFCGGFIARISKGRTLREFIFGVILVPMVLTIGWFSIWGGSAGYIEVNDIAPLWESVQEKPESGIYMLLDSMPGGWWLGLMVLFNIVIFAVTTSDSASFFAAMQVSMAMRTRKFPCVCCGASLSALPASCFSYSAVFPQKSLAIVVGAPFFFVGIAYMFSVYRMLRQGKEKGISIFTSRKVNVSSALIYVQAGRCLQSMWGTCRRASRFGDTP
ncbi:BCCT family transporter [Oceanimonas sp. NS1]|nr:BCCT family transporter [Oceanimonas sp. NS1]